jgi:hypothetical protein
MKARLALKAAMAEKVVINGSVSGGEMQARGKSVLELLADEFGAGLFGLHDEIREEGGSQQLPVDSSQQKKERRLNHREHKGRSPPAAGRHEDIERRSRQLRGVGEDSRPKKENAPKDRGEVFYKS